MPSPSPLAASIESAGGQALAWLERGARHLQLRPGLPDEVLLRIGQALAELAILTRVCARCSGHRLPDFVSTLKGHYEDATLDALTLGRASPRYYYWIMVITLGELGLASERALDELRQEIEVYFYRWRGPSDGGLLFDHLRRIFEPTDVAASNEADLRLSDRLHLGGAATPSRQQLYELTHTVFYASDYGLRRWSWNPQLQTQCAAALWRSARVWATKNDRDLCAELLAAAHMLEVGVSQADSVTLNDDGCFAWQSLLAAQSDDGSIEARLRRAKPAGSTDASFYVDFSRYHATSAFVLACFSYRNRHGAHLLEVPGQGNNG